jgi:hypothetical protein
MTGELLIPETDKEHEMCWKIFTSASPTATKHELSYQMSLALHTHRTTRQDRLLQRGHHQ